MVFRAEKSRWESCDKFVYTSVGTEHSHWSVFDSCQNISIIAYLFYLSFVLGIAVGGLMLRLKAKEFCDDPAFKASVGWYINWKRRHSITLRTKTTLAQRLPNDLEEQTVKSGSWSQLVSAMDALCPEFSIWMRHQCGLRWMDEAGKLTVLCCSYALFFLCSLLVFKAACFIEVFN